MVKRKDKTRGLPKHKNVKVRKVSTKDRLKSIGKCLMICFSLFIGVSLFDLIIPLCALVIAFSIFYINIKDFITLSKKKLITSLFVGLVLFVLAIPAMLPIFKIVTCQGESVTTQIVSVETRRKSTTKFKTIEGDRFKSIGIIMDFKLVGVRKYRDVEIKFVDSFFGKIAYSVKEIE